MHEHVSAYAPRFTVPKPTIAAFYTSQYRNQRTGVPSVAVAHVRSRTRTQNAPNSYTDLLGDSRPLARCPGRSAHLLQAQSANFWHDPTIAVRGRIRHVPKHC